MLPTDKARRSKFFKRVIDTGAILHAAVEGIDLIDESDLGRWEDIFLIDNIVDPMKILRISSAVSRTHSTNAQRNKAELCAEGCRV